MNRTIRLCALAGSDGIAIPAPFVDVRRRGLFSSRVPSLSEKGTCSRSELEAFSLSRTVVVVALNAVTRAVSNPLSSGIQLTESIDEI